MGKEEIKQQNLQDVKGNENTCHNTWMVDTIKTHDKTIKCMTPGVNSKT